MSPDRRLMRFPIPLALVFPFLRGEAGAISRSLPADATPLGNPYWSPDHGALMFTVHSVTFEPVPPTMTIPIGNAPYLAETNR